MRALPSRRGLVFFLLIGSEIAAAAGFGSYVTARSEAMVPGRMLYLDSCASCHGLNLEGQSNWMDRLASGRLKAPPHDATGHTWHYSDDQLFTIVKSGLAAISPGYESYMPASEGILSDQQISGILA